MQKMTVSCQICGKILSITEKDKVTEEDLSNAVDSSSCNEDGQQTLSNGQPNIVAIKVNI